MAENYWLVFLMGITGIWKAIPVGIVLKMNPVVISIATILGATVGIVVIYLMGSRVKRYMVSRLKRKSSLKKKSERYQRLLDKYGPAGLGILGSLIFGPNATMALGLILVNSERNLLLWTFVGTVLWSSVLTWLAATGIQVIGSI
jgi:membrane protein DedA with SNARE-associated domain